MGRGRVQLKRIENKINRQVTFSKRRTGLVKKAHEISVLCDAEVALIIFSHRGKLFEFSSDSCMEKVLERYERYSYAERQLASNEPDTQVNWTFDFAKLKAKLELLHRNHRHYLGQDLDSLNMKDIQSLEQQLDSALKHIRSRKNQLMHESISDLQKKERAMQEQNNMLSKKIKERGKANAQAHQLQWNQQPQQHQQHQQQHQQQQQQHQQQQQQQHQQQQQQQQQHHQQRHAEASDYLMQASLPSLNMSDSHQGELAGQVRRNDLDLTLEPIYSCHMGCFTT